MEFGKKVKIKGTKNKVTLTGKAMVQEDGKITEKLVVTLDTSRMTLKDALPFLKHVVVDPSAVEE
jgi:hypothetical protein